MLHLSIWMHLMVGIGSKDYCPNCGERYEVDYDNYKYCPNRVQAIRHEENLEGEEDE